MVKYLVLTVVAAMLCTFSVSQVAKAQDTPKAESLETFPNQPNKADSCPVNSKCATQKSGDCCDRGEFMGRGPVRRFIRDRRPIRRFFGRVFGRRGCCN